MGKLNAPREIPYEFRVFLLDDVVWLYDNSCREYPCTMTPHIYADPLYCIPPEDISDEAMDEFDCTEGIIGLDGSLFIAKDIEKMSFETIDLDDDEQGPDVLMREAWDTAREEAHANCRI